MIELLILHALFLLAPLVYMKHTGKNIAKETGLEKEKLKKFPKPTILIFAALVIASMALSALFIAGEIDDSEKVTEVLRETQQNTPLIIYIMLVGVPLEEFFFRGFLVKRAGKFLSSILFGIMHFGYGSIAEVAGAIALGYVLAWFFEKHKNLYANTFAHLMYNTLALAIVALA